jgi:hemolysin III
MQSAIHVFPSYTRYERRVDNVIHIIGFTAAPFACVWLLLHVSGIALTGSLSVYCLGLVAMLGTSALYNMLPPIPVKEIVRRMDHAVIFVMIAGTYTPLAVNRLSGSTGWLIALFVWLAAAAGIALSLLRPHQYQRTRLALYLLLGWAIVLVIGPLASSVQQTTLVMLLAGGIAYTLGAGIHVLQRVSFHNAIWHGLVLLAASLHFIAIKIEFVN